MTIIECINEKTALNLNPFQVFVFLNQKTKKFENRLRLLANRKQSFNVVFVDDDPRSHIQACLPETMDFQLYTIIMNSDIVARVMPKWAGDYRYLTEVLPARDEDDPLDHVGFILFDSYKLTILFSDIAPLVSFDEDNVCLGIYFQFIILWEYALIGVEVDDPTLVVTENLGDAIAWLWVIGGQNVRTDDFSVGSYDAEAIFHTIPASQEQCSKYVRIDGVELKIAELLPSTIALDNAALTILDGNCRSVR